ncbi:MAG: thioredoxin-like domain-containing protein [Opitutales bacterium]
MPTINVAHTFDFMTIRLFIGFLLAGLVCSCSSVKDAAPERVDMNVVLPDTLLAASGESISRENLKGKLVGLYFSASWCPPCRAFTPKLIAFRNSCSSKFEVVLVGGDSTPEEQQSYVTTHGMPWLSLVNNGAHANKLGVDFGVRSIPTLIILSPEGVVITTDGRGDVEKEGSSAIDMWIDKAS